MIIRRFKAKDSTHNLIMDYIHADNLRGGEKHTVHGVHEDCLDYQQ